METVRITRRFTFEMAHALRGHDGPCRNIHGHSYILDVCIKGLPKKEKGHPKDGMLIDFTDLSKLIKEAVVEDFDHSLALQVEDSILSVEKEASNNKILRLPFQPTCENLVIEMSFRIRKLLPNNLLLHHLRLQETATSWAEWHIDDHSD